MVTLTSLAYLWGGLLLCRYMYSLSPWVSAFPPATENVDRADQLLLLLLRAVGAEAAAVSGAGRRRIGGECQGGLPGRAAFVGPAHRGSRPVQSNSGGFFWFR